MALDPLSQASTALNLLTGLNATNWNIQESSYGTDPKKPILFHIFKTPSNFNGAVDEVQDNWSRRVIPFDYPYIDGQTNDDLGRNGESFVFNILIFGQNYYAQYRALIGEFNKSTPGTLVHPIRGPMTVKPKEAKITHRASDRQAVALQVTFVEHNFEISFTAPTLTTKSTLASAVGFISKIANVVNTVQSITTVASGVRTSLVAALTGYQNSYSSTLVALNVTFNAGSSSDLPSLLPNNAGATTFPSAEAPNSPFSGVNQNQINSSSSQAQSSLQMISSVAALRTQLLGIIQSMEQAANGQGALIYYDQILTLKQSAQAAQQSLQIGLQSSTSQVVNYTVPSNIVMSLREVCFANGLNPDDAVELEQLNPSLLSTNMIPGGTVLQVPTA
jgi:prophage DNA circulation protein